MSGANATSSLGLSERPAARFMPSNPALLRSIFSKFTARCRAPDCSSSIGIANSERHIEIWRNGAQKIPPTTQISAVSCLKCHTYTCGGCGKEPTMGPDNIFTSCGVVNLCCPEGRLYGIYILLSHFDYREVNAKALHIRNRSSSKSKKAKASVPAHLAHLENVSNGIGYAGGWEPYYGHASNNTPAAKFVDPELEKPDDLTVLTLKLITALLPDARSRDSNLLCREILCLFRYSLLFDCLAELIRNDSIADMVERRELYAIAFTFLEAVADHSDFRQLLYEERLNMKDSPGLHALSTDRSIELPTLEQAPSEWLPSISTTGRNLYKQAQALMKIIGKNAEDILEYSKESSRMCGIVIKAFEKIEGNDPLLKIPQSSPSSSGSWVKWCEAHSVTFSDDVLENHRYKDAFSTLKSSNKGRLTAIGKEIANMTTSLPTGIFLKVAESRSDVMKVLIVGIEDTPYAGGLFTFDLFLDSNYPTSPPKLSFTLDGNDNEEWSFNPNLHKGTGTVCLSIINTWQGNATEMWQPGKSTILAVLISIQAMILGAPLPWINEPGFAMQAKTPEAQDHKLLIQYKTVRYAMLGWLQPVDKRYAVWDDIQRVYWQYNGLSTLLAVKEWAKSNGMIVKIPAPKPTKKVKKKINLPPIPFGDLLEKLATALDLRAHLDPPAEHDEISSTGRPKRQTTGSNKGKEKRKAEDLSDLESDDVNDMLEWAYNAGLGSEPKAKSTSKRKKTGTATIAKSKPKAGTSKSKGKAKIKSDEEEEITTKWVYTGGKNQKESRQACGDFGISGAKSIKDTITKLEAYVNDNNLGEDDLAQTWGALESI